MSKVCLYSKSMNPHLLANDLILFRRLLDGCRVYFEYGSGGSTYEANSMSNIVTIYSVESDIEWQKKLLTTLNTSYEQKIAFMYNEMDTKPNSWGHPGKHATNLQKASYSDHMKKLSKCKRDEIDLVMIDGRFRVACCLKCFDIVKDDCMIVFDDFMNREQYHVVLDYFKIVEKTVDDRMVVLQKKLDIKTVPEQLIQKYELIAD